MFEKKTKQAAPFLLRGVTQYYIRIKYNKAGELQEKHESLTLETCHAVGHERACFLIDKYSSIKVFLDFLFPFSSS